ncbi:MAG: RibD family protein, partial [Chitinophagales bacterium]
RFFTFMEKKRPYVILKWAQTIDGYIGLANRELAISNHFSKTLLHKWRSEEAAIMVGTNTALNDDPLLDARLWNQQQPLRIALDRNLRLPMTLHLFNGTVATLVFTSRQREPLPNIEFVIINFETGLIEQVLSKLHERQIQSVLVEGGSSLLQTFINSGQWDEARIFIASKILGNGIAAPEMEGHIIAKERIGDDDLIILQRRP